MNEGSFLSKLLLLVSIAVLSVVFLIFPTILNNPDSSINIYTLKDVWQNGSVALPVITKLSISFTDQSLIRFVVFFVLVLIGILSEFFVDNKKASGLVHILNLIIAMMTGALFLFSLVVPFMPL
ncbi:MAG: hypothetical protein KAT34_19175 [Candidatus Aminicenantes bacterium]|nr:hypothetical protein [Candidatus Aminicenantes bacterium]